MRISWNCKYCIGIDEIDKQHEGFMDMLNHAYDAYSGSLTKIVDDDDRRRQVYLDVLKLREYALNHFSTEEKYMIKHKYPKFFDHKREHDNFIKTVFDMEDKLLNTNEMSLTDLLDFVSDWYKNHISVVDKQLGAFLKAAHVK